MKPLISIVILNYNGEEYIDISLKSILNLNYENLEVILVDNNSTDESLNIINLISKGKIKIIKNKINFGSNKGRQIGIENSNGKYVLLLDGDIEITDENIIPKLLELHISDKNIAFTQLPIIDVNKDRTIYYGIYFSIYDFVKNLKPLTMNEINRMPKTLQIGSPTGACLFFERSTWDKIGGFDLSQPYHMDEFDLGPRAWIFGFKNILYSKSYLIHHGVKHSITKDVIIKRFSYLFSGHARGLIKNYNTKNLILRFPIFFLYHFLKSILYSFKNRDLRIFFAYIKSLYFFILSLKELKNERQKIQSKRKIKEDLFLNIKPPII